MAKLTNRTIETRTPLKSGGYIDRKTRLQTNPNGRRFKDAFDPEFWAYLGQQVEHGVPCDCGCGRRATDRCHLIPRNGQGGKPPPPDKGNVVLLARSCHRDQEKRTDEFNAERGCNLWESARFHGERFDTEKRDESW